MQKLPTGDWWTSLDADFLSTVDARELKDLSTAHAELVAILPSASTSSAPIASASTAPTLGSYVKKPPGKKHAAPGSRQVSCGGFLDYGLHASFAPTFDQDGVEVGRETLGEVLWYQERQKQVDQVNLRLPVQATEAEPIATSEHASSNDADEVQDITDKEREKQAAKKMEETNEALEALLSSDQVSSIKSALDTLELEIAVDELLARNARALKRLEELQLRRLGAEDGGTSTVEIDSEEWALGMSCSCQL